MRGVDFQAVLLVCATVCGSADYAKATGLPLVFISGQEKGIQCDKACQAFNGTSIPDICLVADSGGLLQNIGHLATYQPSQQFQYDGGSASTQANIHTGGLSCVYNQLSGTSNTSIK